MFSVNQKSKGVFLLFLLVIFLYRVRTGPGKPGKSWNFIVEKGYWSWKVLEIC